MVRVLCAVAAANAAFWLERGHTPVYAWTLGLQVFPAHTAGPKHHKDVDFDHPHCSPRMMQAARDTVAYLHVELHRG